MKVDAEVALIGPDAPQAVACPPRHVVVAHALLMAVCCFSLVLSADDMEQPFDSASPGHLHSEAAWAHHHPHERM